MDSVTHESTQQMLRPGHCVDLAYPNPDTSKKQCFRTTVNTRYATALTNLASGVSQFTISPSNGVGDILLILRFPSSAESTATGNAIPLGWGFQAIKNISFRCAGDSQYFCTGQQLMIQALDNCSDANARDSLFSFAGSLCKVVGDFTDSNYAYIYVKTPWSHPSAEGKQPALPTDLLSMQVLVTVELNPISTYCSTNGGTVPTSLKSGQFVVQQVQFQNQGDSLARRVDMTTHSLAYGINFAQQASQISFTNIGSGVYNASLQGFRSGECTAIYLWLTMADDTANAGYLSPLQTYRPQDVVVTYMGNVYANYPNDSGALWNLINGKLVPEVANTLITGYASSAYTTSALASKWIRIPFAQCNDPGASSSEMLVSGLEITNGQVQVQFTLPLNCRVTPGTTNARTGPVFLNYFAEYNATWIFGSGTASLAF